MQSRVIRLCQFAAGVLALSATAHAGAAIPVTTPEPGTLFLLGGGIGAVLLLRKLRQKK